LIAFSVPVLLTVVRLALLRVMVPLRLPLVTVVAADPSPNVRFQPCP